MQEIKETKDEPTWVVFELNHAGEVAAEDGTLLQHLLEILPVQKDQIFIPCLTYVSAGRKSVLNAMEGYCFVRSTLEDSAYFACLKRTPFLKGVLFTKVAGMPVLNTVTETKIQEVRYKLSELAASDLQEGSQVLVTKGVCAGLKATVLYTLEQEAVVHIDLRSLKTIRVLPRFALLPLGDTSDE